ncbi:MAG: aminoglycoside phosphotransferase family protein [Clostridiales bacterium]|nr:aminoglycoside phosphotransferase family protein [Clostridiales bacterium]
MQAIINAFPIEGNAVSCERYGSGHINETYLLLTDAPHKYILQKINHNIFKDVDGLMANVAAVTGYLFKQTPDSRRVLTLVKTKNGANYYKTENGEYFRLYEFVTDSLCMDRVETAEDFYQSAVAFGQFQQQLTDFPAETLNETIPHFHDTIDRYRIFHEALKADPLGRSAGCQAEIEFVLAREEEAGVMVRMMQEGKLPLRVTHNDTKLNNVMLDAKTRTPLCVIDLDTVMPGLAGNDFGDSIRFGANTAAEDEQDLSKVQFSIPLFEAYAKGFLSACGEVLTQAEIDTLPLGAKLMTLECGVRFLTDHLMGDTYFRIHRENHNLDRCRTQFKLVAEMEKVWDQMNDLIHQLAGR